MNKQDNYVAIVVRSTWAKTFGDALTMAIDHYYLFLPSTPRRIRLINHGGKPGWGTPFGWQEHSHLFGVPGSGVDWLLTIQFKHDAGELFSIVLEERCNECGAIPEVCGHG